MAALAPVNPQRPVHAGDHHQQGDGTYHVIETDAGGIVVTGLPVYFFGSREPLTVHDLLFYWQD